MIPPTFPRRLFAWLLVLVLAPSVRAEGPLHQQIDQLVSASPGFSQKASPPADDAEFLRRIYLDLVGTIPTAEEARAFLADPASDKRVKLIDRLLASPEHARHMAYVLDVLLMERLPAKQVAQAQWHEYLRQAVADNRPWDQLVREILSADGSDPKERAPARFILDRGVEPHLLTKDLSRLFLGMNLQCAQCHDHPIVPDYHQAHYYGLYAFLDRTSLLTDARKKLAMISEKADGETTYQSVFDPSKATKSTLPRILELPPVKEAKLEKGKEYITAPTKTTAGVPRYSRRAQLAGEMTRPENVAFRRSFVNHLWALLMGRGLIHPLDMSHEGNPPSHPEVLELLAEEALRCKYDMRHLLRELALSQTYQRSSASRGEVAAEPALHATALVRGLSPEQLAWSLMQASGLADAERKALGARLSEAALHAALARQATPLVNAFAGAVGEPEAFDATIEQALYLTNGPLLRSWLKPRAGNLTSRLVALKTSDEVADELYLSVYTRYPSPEERRDVGGYLQGRADRPQALEEMAWAMLTSIEMRFNH